MTTLLQGPRTPLPCSAMCSPTWLDCPKEEDENGPGRRNIDTGGTTTLPTLGPLGILQAADLPGRCPNCAVALNANSGSACP